ncbi:MAG: 2-hydroxyhepta-2,4-diene,7-dioate isomerase [Schumannella sp.]|nr:2-hydroxyhepta-2,4-diene,7-dioate isomerase [Schumannella sp.]
MRFSHLSITPNSPPRLAAVIGDGALFLDEVLADAPRDLQELIERDQGASAELRRAVRVAVTSGATLRPVYDLHHASAVLRPPHVIAVGANYAAHASELNLRTETAATVFSLWPNSLAGHRGTTTWPADLTSEVDYEAELGVIIGRPARNVAAADALDYVFGYTVVNDITARDLQFSEAQWSRSKSFDGFTPNGPVVVTADEIADPQDLWLTTNVDGMVLQEASTADMVRSVAEIIEFLSRSATLLPGTLISTGSPGGAGYSRDPRVFLTHKSTVTVTIGGIGFLTTYCSVV